MLFLELVAALFGLLCVWLTVRQHIACWPAGLVMVALYIVIFFQAKLYSDMLLQVVYVFLQAYGWHAWLHGGPHQSRLPVSRLSPLQIGIWIVAVAAASWSWGNLMLAHTDASFPRLDAFTTVASLAAQWLMGRKKLESWLVWIVVDVVSIGLYLAKDLYLTAGLYAIFLLLAILGFLAWTKSLPAAAPA